MKLFQIGVTAQEKIAVYIVDGVTITNVDGQKITDSTGKVWGSLKGYKYNVGENLFVTHVSTKDRKMNIHSVHSTKVFNEVVI